MLFPVPLKKLRTKYENEHSRYINVDGLDIHYRDEGEGPLLVLVHGLLASLHTWDGWVEHLKHHYRVLRLDVPGFGLTGPHAEMEYTPEYAAHFCEKLVRAIGVNEPFYLAGSSLGGFISWNYAALYPDRVKKLILLDPIGYPQPLPWVLRLVTQPVMRHFARFVTPKPLLVRNLREIYGDHGRLSEDKIQTYYELLRRSGNRDSMVRFFDTLVEYSTHPTLKERIKEVKAPTLLMWGREDRWVPVELVQQWIEDVRNIQHIIYDGVGHIPMEELPLPTVRDALAFLQAD